MHVFGTLGAFRLKDCTWFIFPDVAPKRIPFQSNSVTPLLHGLLINQAVRGLKPLEKCITEERRLDTRSDVNDITSLSILVDARPNLDHFRLQHGHGRDHPPTKQMRAFQVQHCLATRDGAPRKHLQSRAHIVGVLAKVEIKALHV